MIKPWTLDPDRLFDPEPSRRVVPSLSERLTLSMSMRGQCLCEAQLLHGMPRM